MNTTQLKHARKTIDEAFARLIAAQTKSERTSLVRLSLPAGSSRARVTTANARWMRASEDRDRCEQRLRDLGIDVVSINGGG